ncbi:MAG: DUF2207 domain-containing protein [Gammaproteobacteria bacterium]|nr:DUF2207 domain-containing protein [Gammaproteobacteria bacterium]MBU1654927.1 DUF2207 domain-containing protein [Gammaproteobacteria bacterium]MBU1962382.1 DUF2207 domain-containing protein [Gammaproteobacteria bacterium]
MPHLLRLLFLLATLLTDGTALAEEAILDYASEIQVETGGAMTVRETIRVRAEGNQIKRGIYRDFPTDYQDRMGNAYRVGFTLVAVERDGKSEPYREERRGNGVRIYVGDKDRFLQPGEYSYSLTYRTDRQLGFFADHDELYWNVTGNGWEFPIEQVSARVLLPSTIPADSIRVEGYTGYQGSQEQNYRARVDPEGAALFETTTPLGNRQGLTLVVSWPKGHVTEPSNERKLGWFLADNREALFAGIGLALLLLYYFIAWGKVGRDPEPGVIIPIYTPPEGLSPAAMRFVSRMGYDAKALSAAIVNMAVARYLRIEEDAKGQFALIRQIGQNPTLAAGESPAATALFSSVNRLEMKRENHATFSSALDQHRRSLKRDYEKRYFLTNSLYLLPGVLLSLLVVLVTLLSLPSGEERITAGSLALLLSFWSIALFVRLKGTANAWGNLIRTGNGWGRALSNSLIAILFLAGEVVWIVGSWIAGSLTLALLSIALVATNLLFYEWMKAPTLLGRKLLDRIEGFKHYLEVAEQEELDLAHPPEKTPELFERYLPYAIALDVETQWAGKFAEVLLRAQESGQDRQPVWYQGGHWDSNNLGRFTSTLGGAMSSAISASSTAPGSSSGGGGGGSSGGGGGGGGGGGW